jgi:hypothetical protein
VHTVKVQVTDDDNGTSNEPTASVTVNYNLSGILQPINDTRNGQPTSLFKSGSTIPVKVQVTDCDGSYPSNLTLNVSAYLIGSNPPTTGVDEAASTVPPTSGTQMRFTGAPDNQYIYNLASKNLADPTATYNVKVTLQQTGQTTLATIGLKK